MLKTLAGDNQITQVHRAAHAGADTGHDDHIGPPGTELPCGVHPAAGGAFCARERDPVLLRRSKACGGRPLQGQGPASEVNAGGCAEQPDHLPYLINPGILQIDAKDGLVAEKIVTGRFAPIATLLPEIGQPANFDLPFSADFPDEIDLDVDFTPRISDPTVTGVVELNSAATIDTPAPLPALGVGMALGMSRKIRRRIKGCQ